MEENENYMESLRRKVSGTVREDTMVFPDMEDAVVGVLRGRVIYDNNLMVEILMNRDGMSTEEAQEFIDYNTMRTLPYIESRGLVPIIVGDDEEFMKEECIE